MLVELSVGNVSTATVTDGISVVRADVDVRKSLVRHFRVVLGGGVIGPDGAGKQPFSSRCCYRLVHHDPVGNPTRFPPLWLFRAGTASDCQRDRAAEHTSELQPRG